jgi:D-3-phosphoglycerate dehydrogenase / 2-oxoglutarate reductase
MSSPLLVTDHGFPDLAPEQTAAAGAGLELVAARCRTAAEVVEAAARHRPAALLVQWAPITAEVVAALPETVRGIVRYGIGVDNVDLAACSARGLPVCNVPDYCIDEVADHTLSLALALARQLPQTHARTLRGEWKITPPAPLPAFRDMTFATAGFGRIARAVLARAAAFGFRLAAYDPFVPEGDFTAAGVTRFDADGLLAADILSLHLPLNAETRHFLNARRLAGLKPSALIVNTSRGGLIDTRALAAALANGSPAGAGLDVFETEPLEPDHPLRSAPNVLLTSHTAWFSQASVPRLQKLAAEEAVRLARGESPRHRVNR